jgi:hypothetical protein
MATTHTKIADLNVTSFFTPIVSSTWAGLANDDGLVVFGWFDSALKAAPPTTASIFAPGCIMINKGGTSTSTAIVANSGTTASVTWSTLTIS